MAIKATKKLDKKITKAYENTVTTNTTSNTPYVDKTETVLEYMNFIAINNKNFLNIK